MPSTIAVRVQAGNRNHTGYFKQGALSQGLGYAGFAKLREQNQDVAETHIRTGRQLLPQRGLGKPQGSSGDISVLEPTGSCSEVVLGVTEETCRIPCHRLPASPLQTSDLIILPAFAQPCGQWTKTSVWWFLLCCSTCPQALVWVPEARQHLLALALSAMTFDPSAWNASPARPSWTCNHPLSPVLEPGQRAFSGCPANVEGKPDMRSLPPPPPTHRSQRPCIAH